MEDFLSISFLSRTCVRGAKAGLSSRTPKVHPDDELWVRFRTNIRNMGAWFAFHYSRCSHDNGKSQTSIRPIPIGVRRISRHF